MAIALSNSHWYANMMLNARGISKTKGNVTSGKYVDWTDRRQSEIMYGWVNRDSLYRT